MRTAIAEAALPVVRASRRRCCCSACSSGSAASARSRSGCMLFKGAFGDWFSWQNTLQRAAPLMLTALCVALPARAGLIDHRRRRRAGAGRPGLRRRCPMRCRCRATSSARALVCIAGALAGAAWIALAGCAAAVPRRQRDHQQPAARLHRDRAVQALRRRAAARPGQPEQAVDARARRRRCASAASAAPTCTGAWCSAWSRAWRSACGSRSPPRGFAVRVVGGNPRTAQLVGPAGQPADPARLRARRRLRRAGRRGRGGGGAHQRQRLADRGLRLRRHPGRRSSRATTRWRSSRWRSCSAASARPAACCSAASGLPDASVLVLQGIAFVLILASEALRGVDWNGSCGGRRPATCRRGRAMPDARRRDAMTQGTVRA